MYYFIFEYPKNRQLVEIARQVEDEVVREGIAGELVELTPTRNVEALIADAHHKGYQTLVVVGNSKLVNEVAARLLRYEMVLGIVPLQQSASLSELIHSHTWQEAVVALKQRRWIYSAMARITNSEIFLSSIRLAISGTERLIIESGEYKSTLDATELVVAPSNIDGRSPLVSVECQSQINHQPSLKRWWQDLTGHRKTAYSRFRAEEITIKSSDPLKLMIDDSVLARTPTTISVVPRALRLIVAKQSKKS